MFYYNKNVKEESYQPGESIWLKKYFKIKQNPKLEYKYFGPLEILKIVQK